MHSLLVLLNLAFLATFAACSTTIGGPISDQDDLFDPDAANEGDPTPGDDTSGDDSPIDDVLARCGVPASVGDLGARTGDALKHSESGDDLYEVSILVNPGPPEDILWLGLFEEFGVFDDGIETGTFSISGADTSPETCGACIALDINATATSTDRSLMAQSGQLTITSLNGSVTGSAQDLVLREYDPQTGAPVPGGCETKVDSIQFSAPLP